MPSFPTPVDLSKDKKFNKELSLNVAVCHKLDGMTEQERNGAFDRSLTTEHREQYYKFVESSKTLNSSISSMLEKVKTVVQKPLNLNYDYPIYNSAHIGNTGRINNKHTQYTASYNSTTQILTVDGESIVLSSSEKRAIICEIVFMHKSDFKTLISYKLMLKNYQQLLKAYGIDDKRQLQTAKIGINQAVKRITGKDFFIGRGGLQRNPIFRFNR